MFNPIPVDIKTKIVSAFQNGSRNPDASEVLDILLAAAKLVDQMYIVLDGIDECKGDDRAELISGMQSLSNRALGSTKLYVSSRADVDIERAFRDWSNLQLSTENIMPDIEAYIIGIIHAKSQTDELFVKDEVILEEIITTLTDKAVGM